MSACQTEPSFDLGATETTVLRSSTIGAAARDLVIPPSDVARKLAIIAETGPQGGVLRVSALTSKVIDLKSKSLIRRKVVTSIDVPAHTTVKLRNVTPPGRLARTVNVAGAAVIAHGNPWNADHEYVSSTILHATSPASSTLIDIQAPSQRVTFGFSFANYVDFTLVKPGLEESAAYVSGFPLLREETDAVYSAGWSRDSQGGTTNGTIMRSPAPNSGATYRPLCVQVAPQGCCGIHDDGAPRPVDHRECHADWPTQQRYPSGRTL